MTDRVTAYVKEVVKSGRYPDTGQLCGDLHILACKRHLRDLERQNTKEFPYYWDPEASERVLDFAGTLTLSEGKEPRPLRLMGCQAFDIGCTFGWKKSVNGCRRFRRRYKSISRQQGKTMENGVMGTYVAGFSGYKHGKLFTTATKKRQSRLAWEEMSRFIKADPDLSELFQVKDYKSFIIATETECTIEALSREAGLDDGFRAIFASVDELHQHPDNSIYKALYNGTRSLPETLISMITTRGKKLNSFCYEMDKYAQDVLRGLSTAEDFFVDIYCMNDGDDPFNEDNWSKSCPYTCSDTERLEVLRQDAQTARDMGGMELADFLCKSLNMWVKNTDDQFIDPDAWQACGSDRTLSDIVEAGHRDCWVGLDLSSGGDLTTLAFEFPLELDRYYLHSHSFMPRGRLEEHVETDLAPYHTWEQAGLITVTGGSMDFMNDYKFIISYLKELKERYHLNFLGIGIDPHNAAGVMQDLETFDCPVVIITQSARSLNDATVAVQLLTKSHSFEYDRKNELLTWSMINAAIVRNSFEEIKVDKKPGAKFKRIDPVDAVVDSHALMLKKFAIAFKGKLIPVSRILLSAAKASIMNYLNRWFVRNAILSENTKIFSVLKSGYNSGTPKALSGWKALKKSINKDIDPSCKIDGVIITNQSGWAYLDEEEDTTGRPILQPNPANATQKLFQNMVVHVFPDAQLPNIDGTHAPVIYGDTKAGCTFVEHQALEFAVSEHYLFNKNQNCLRVIEGFDAFSTDTEAYIYGSLDISSKAAA